MRQRISKSDVLAAITAAGERVAMKHQEALVGLANASGRNPERVLPIIVGAVSLLRIVPLAGRDISDLQAILVFPQSLSTFMFGRTFDVELEGEDLLDAVRIATLLVVQDRKLGPTVHRSVEY